MRRGKYLLALGLLLMSLSGGWFLLSESPKTARAESSETDAVAGSGTLDGMTFASELGPLGKPADVKDSLVFANGTFVSTECEKRCGYPARPYYVRHVGDKIEFISETRCPGKDAKIVWRGTVADGQIKGEYTWTVARWYWTIEKEFWFEGTLIDRAVPVASGR
jgi:hypothetical protein